MTQILKGAEVNAVLNARVALRMGELKQRGVLPTLAVVRVGERDDDLYYERSVIRRAEELGVVFWPLRLPENVSTTELMETLEKLNDDDSIHGVLLFRPLPEHLDENRVRNALSPLKDIDGITDLSLAGVFSDTALGYAPCTAVACMEILAHYGIQLAGKKAVVVGRSLVVGKPVAMLLLAQHATVTIAHSRTENLAELVRGADIIVACAGRAQMLGAEYFSPEQVVIDVGINVVEGGSVVGDVATDEAIGTVQAVTPVPGGVGTVTTGTLMKHVVQAASKQAALQDAP